MNSLSNVGAYVHGAHTSPRELVQHAELLAAYSNGEIPDEREASLSHFAFGPEMQTYFIANHKSVAGFAGACWAPSVLFDIDRPNLSEALADARRLVEFLNRRYPEAEGDVPIWFSGSKGFHVALELAHNPPPAVGFQCVARTFAEALAAAAGVKIDNSIYELNSIIRLPNTRHPRTGLFKRLIDLEALLMLEIEGIREHAKYAAGDGMPTLRTVPAQLASDWAAAERETRRAHEARVNIRRDAGPTDERAPRYFIDVLRFGVEEGERRPTLFRCAAWLTEQGAPPSLCFAILTEPGRDVGVTPKDVQRQIECGIAHARKQRASDPMPDPADAEACERWAIQHEGDPLPPGALSFDFGANVAGPYGAEGGRR